MCAVPSTSIGLADASRTWSDMIPSRTSFNAHIARPGRTARPPSASSAEHCSPTEASQWTSIAKGLLRRETLKALTQDGAESPAHALFLKGEAPSTPKACMELVEWSACVDEHRFLDLLLQHVPLSASSLRIEGDVSTTWIDVLVHHMMSGRLQARSLTFCACKLNNASAMLLAKALRACHSLVSLDLSCNLIGSAGAEALFEALRHNDTLASLELLWNPIADEGAAAAAAMLRVNRALRHLGLGSIAMEGGIHPICSALESNTTLASLDLSGNSLRGEGPKAVARMLEANRTLVDLDLEDIDLRDEGAEDLATAAARNSALRRLNVSRNTDLSADGMLRMIDGLVAARLSSLDLRGIGLDDTGARRLADGLASSPLRILNVGCNAIGDDGASALFDALCDNGTLQTLVLENVRLAAKGCNAAADFLRSNHTLRSLDLSDNSIDPAACDQLARGLRHNTALTHLDLGFNYVGDEGCRALSAAMIEGNSALISLQLEKNGIGDAGAQALAAALVASEHLRVMDLTNNQIGHPGIEALCTALHRNVTLARLSVAGNQISDPPTLALLKKAVLNRFNLRQVHYRGHDVEADPDIDSHIERNRRRFIDAAAIAFCREAYADPTAYGFVDTGPLVAAHLIDARQMQSALNLAMLNRATLHAATNGMREIPQ